MSRDHKNEQPDASKEAEKTDARKQDDNIEDSEQTKNTSKDEQFSNLTRTSKSRTLRNYTNKDEAHNLFSDSESNRTKGETRPSPCQRTITDRAPPKHAHVKRVIEVEGLVNKSEEKVVLGRGSRSSESPGSKTQCIGWKMGPCNPCKTRHEKTRSYGDVISKLDTARLNSYFVRG